MPQRALRSQKSYQERYSCPGGFPVGVMAASGAGANVTQRILDAFKSSGLLDTGVGGMDVMVNILFNRSTKRESTLVHLVDKRTSLIKAMCIANDVEMCTVGDLMMAYRLVDSEMYWEEDWVQITANEEFERSKDMVDQGLLLSFKYSHLVKKRVTVSDVAASIMNSDHAVTCAWTSTPSRRVSIAGLQATREDKNLCTVLLLPVFTSNIIEAQEASSRFRMQHLYTKNVLPFVMEVMVRGIKGIRNAEPIIFPHHMTVATTKVYDDRYPWGEEGRESAPDPRPSSSHPGDGGKERVLSSQSKSKSKGREMHAWQVTLNWAKMKEHGIGVARVVRMLEGCGSADVEVRRDVELDGSKSEMDPVLWCLAREDPYALCSSRYRDLQNDPKTAFSHELIYCYLKVVGVDIGGICGNPLVDSDRTTTVNMTILSKYLGIVSAKSMMDKTIAHVLSASGYTLNPCFMELQTATCRTEAFSWGWTTTA